MLLIIEPVNSVFWGCLTEVSYMNMLHYDIYTHCTSYQQVCS